MDVREHNKGADARAGACGGGGGYGSSHVMRTVLAPAPGGGERACRSKASVAVTPGP